MTQTGKRARRSFPKYEDWFCKDGYTRHELALLMAGLSPDWPFSRAILDACDDDIAMEELCKVYLPLADHLERFDRFNEADDLIFKAIHIGTLTKALASDTGLIPRLEAIQFVLHCDSGHTANADRQVVPHRYRTFIEAAKSAAQASRVSANAPVALLKAGPDASTVNWKMDIQAEAARRWVRLIEQQCKPSKNNLASDLARWAVEKDLKGALGKALSAEYIRRHVLRDWTPPD